MTIADFCIGSAILAAFIWILYVAVKSARENFRGRRARYRFLREVERGRR